MAFRRGLRPAWPYTPHHAAVTLGSGPTCCPERGQETSAAARRDRSRRDRPRLRHPRPGRRGGQPEQPGQSAGNPGRCAARRAPRQARSAFLYRLDAQVDQFAARASGEREWDHLERGLAGRADPQARGCRLAPVITRDDIAVLQHRGRGGAVGQRDQGWRRRVPACRVTEPGARDAGGDDPGMAEQGARVPGQVGELQGVEDAAGCTVAVLGKQVGRCMASPFTWYCMGPDALSMTACQPRRLRNPATGLGRPGRAAITGRSLWRRWSRPPAGCVAVWPWLPDADPSRGLEPQLVSGADTKRGVELVEVPHDLVAAELARGNAGRWRAAG